MKLERRYKSLNRLLRTISFYFDWLYEFSPLRLGLTGISGSFDNLRPLSLVWGSNASSYFGVVGSILTSASSLRAFPLGSSNFIRILVSTSVDMAVCDFPTTRSTMYWNESFAIFP